MWLDDAETLIRLRLGDVDALDQDVLAMVEREAVVAVVNNPDGTTTRQVSVDDGSESVTWKRAAGTVVIRDEWWDMLTPQRAADTAYAIDTVPSSTAGHAFFCPHLQGSAFCTCGAILLNPVAYAQ